VISIDCDFILIAARVMGSECCRSVQPDARVHFGEVRALRHRDRVADKRLPTYAMLRLRHVQFMSRTPNDVSTAGADGSLSEQPDTKGSVSIHVAMTLVLLL
jgi:hypothetical protein